MMHYKLCVAVSAMVFLFATLGSARAEAAGGVYPDYAFRPAEANGLSARIQFNMTFGGKHAGTQSAIALTAGPVWQTQSASPHLQRGPLQQASVAALGFPLSGKPVFKLGGLDLLDLKQHELNAEGNDHTVRNIVLGVAAAAAIGGLVLASLVHEVCKHSPEPAPGDPSCP